MNRKFLAVLLTTLSAISALTGCAQQELTRPSPTSASSSSGPLAGSVAPTVAESADAATEGRDVEPDHSDSISQQEDEAIDIMWRLIGAYGEIDENAVRAAGRNGHPGLVPVLVEAASRTFEPDLALEISIALESITNDSVGGDFVLTGPWFSWMSRQDPPQVMLKGFDEWKGQLLGTIDPSFTEFLYSDVPTRIPLWTVEWGGVVRDGIPPLEFPKVRDGGAVDFLNLNEPVFGVTINGESRAYPHRIMGWHELANDRLGGELITFVF